MGLSCPISYVAPPLPFPDNLIGTNRGSDMHTLILAWVIGLLGLIMIGGGIWGVFDLFRQTVRAPLRSYGTAISMICGGMPWLA